MEELLSASALAPILRGRMPKLIEVSKRALSQRIDRLLRKEGKALRSHRGTDLWYVVDEKTDAVLKSQLTLKKLAVETGALRTFERLVD